jgi:3-oxoacyl-[acyl-carrier protein] reductase
MFEGRVALVTGARSGIGLAVARQFAKNGANVIMVSRSEKIKSAATALSNELSHRDQRIIGISADFSDENQVSRVFDLVNSQFGGIDILINNAGVSHTGRIEAVSLREWEDVFKNNLTSAFLCSRAAVALMRNKNSGAIVNVSSVAGRSASLISSVAYTASKAGMIGLTRQLAKEVASAGIRVNAIAPSQTDTEMLNEALAKVNKKADDIAKVIPLGKIATPEQVADVCLYLSGPSSSYITGAVIDVNGGSFVG